MAKTKRQPTHDLVLVVDSYEDGVDDEAKTIEITEPVAAIWMNDDGTFGGAKVTRNRVLIKGDKLKLFARKKKESAE